MHNINLRSQQETYFQSNFSRNNTRHDFGNFYPIFSLWILGLEQQYWTHRNVNTSFRHTTITSLNTPACYSLLNFILYWKLFRQHHLFNQSTLRWWIFTGAERHCNKPSWNPVVISVLSTSPRQTSSLMDSRSVEHVQRASGILTSWHFALCASECSVFGGVK